MPQDRPAIPIPQVTHELGDVAYQVCTCEVEDDDDFCIVDKNEELGTFPKSSEPEIVWFTKEPVQIIDNFISIPVGRANALKTPEHFPTPTVRYTLCEMTIVWHMYGGNDFKVPDKESKKKTVNFSDTKLDTISFSNRDSGFVNITSAADKKLENIPWTLRGGANRNHSVLMELQLNKVNV